MIKTIVLALLLSLFIAKTVSGRGINDFKQQNFPYVAKAFDDVGVQAAAVVEDSAEDSQSVEDPQPERVFRGRGMKNRRRGNLGKNSVFENHLLLEIIHLNNFS